MSENPEGNPIPEKHQFNQDPAKRKNKVDFWLGLTGCLLVNAILIMLIENVPSSNGVDVVVACLPWVVNLGMIIVVAAMKRPRILIGALSVYAIAIALALVVGVVFVVICFTGGFNGF